MNPMAFEGRYIIFDNHMHLNTTGRFLEAVDMFVHAGGTSFNLVNLPDFGAGADNYYENLYRKTVSMAEIIMKERGMPVPVTLGPYPLDYFKFRDAGMDPVEMMKAGIDLACRYIDEGRAHAIGEIGRPHFDVPEDILAQSNKIMQYGMERAADTGCPVILHTEDLKEEEFRLIEKMAEGSGLDGSKVVKHHALAENMLIRTDIRKSILASRSNVRRAVESGEPFLLETDYVDDPAMGWKVIPPDSVPRRAIMVKAEVEGWREVFEDTFLRLPLELFGEDIFRTFL